MAQDERKGHLDPKRVRRTDRGEGPGRTQEESSLEAGCLMRALNDKLRDPNTSSSFLFILVKTEDSSTLNPSRLPCLLCQLSTHIIATPTLTH